MAPTDSPAGAPWIRALRAVGRFLLGLPRAVPFLLAFSWMGLIWALSSQSFGSGGPGNVYWRTFANLAHAPLFGFLGMFLAAGLLRPRPPETWPRPSAAGTLLVLGLVGLYGAVDEWHQGLVPGRDPSVLDVVTDVVGCACVLWVTAYLGRAGHSESGLRRRLLLGVLVCLVVAWIGALFD